LIVKVREIIRLIEEDGWQFDRQKGSHRQFTHPVKRKRQRNRIWTT
jgi:predicted RNA binding protein YcfA (HicA-like mRNA interferase family)